MMLPLFLLPAWGIIYPYIVYKNKLVMEYNAQHQELANANVEGLTIELEEEDEPDQEADAEDREEDEPQDNR